jgi:hypothetical protein
MQKPVSFLYSNNKQTEKEIQEIIPFPVVYNNSILWDKLTKEVKDLYNENLVP